jgi:hypothetical protein
MSIVYAESYRLETLLAIHDFSADTIKLALFTGDAAFSYLTTAYATTNEISGGGYTAGGNTLALVSTYPKIEDHIAAVRYQTTSWNFSVLIPSVRWALIYNASKANRAILSIDMGGPHAIFGAFNFNFPLSAPPIVAQCAPIAA